MANVHREGATSPATELTTPPLPIGIGGEYKRLEREVESYEDR